MRRWIASMMLGVLVVFNAGAQCTPGGVGDPCIPSDEHLSEFSGFGITEVNIESSSLECATRVCLVNHFQGRVSCPYGQTVENLSESPDSPRRCRLPGSPGHSAGEAVGVPVDAWDTDRPAERAVYCSCRCAGPEENARYCQCPSGFVCTELVPDLDLGREQLAGAYCVRQGTTFRSTDVAGPDCQNVPQDEACPGEPLVNP